jgi:hypothetical protein|nr:MAG TPA: hypothetical protein [Caudoviricetes sp.]DAR52801.1 MAG TPA: hypothetical protein [Caudoviricetes sp.]
MAFTLEDLAVKYAEMEARGKSNTHRLDALEKNQKALNELTTSVKVLATEQSTMKTDIGEIKTGLKTLTDKPGKRWEAIVDKAIWLVAGALIAFVLAQLGL